MVVSDTGDLLHFTLTAGNVDDRKPVADLLRNVFGKVFADKGYLVHTLVNLSQALTERLSAAGIELITKNRKNMKPKPLPFLDNFLLRKRPIIESVIDQRKNISHTNTEQPLAFYGTLRLR